MKNTMFETGEGVFSFFIIYSLSQVNPYVTLIIIVDVIIVLNTAVITIIIIVVVVVNIVIVVLSVFIINRAYSFHAFLAGRKGWGGGGGGGEEQKGYSG